MVRIFRELDILLTDRVLLARAEELVHLKIVDQVAACPIKHYVRSAVLRLNAGLGNQRGGWHVAFKLFALLQQNLLDQLDALLRLLISLLVVVLEFILDKPNIGFLLLLLLLHCQWRRHKPVFQ